MSRNIRNATHQKQNRTQIRRGVPNIAELKEAVPVLRSVPGIGIVEYIRYNGQLYSSAYSIREPVIASTADNISLINDGVVGVYTFEGTVSNSVFNNANLLSTAVDSGTTDGSTTAYKLIQSGQNFLATVAIGYMVKNTTDTTYAIVTEVDSNTQLSIYPDIMETGENFSIYKESIQNDLASLAAKVNEIIRTLRRVNIIGPDGRFGDTKGD